MAPIGAANLSVDTLQLAERGVLVKRGSHMFIGTAFMIASFIGFFLLIVGIFYCKSDQYNNWQQRRQLKAQVKKEAKEAKKAARDRDPAEETSIGAMWANHSLADIDLTNMPDHIFPPRAHVPPPSFKMYKDPASW